MTSISKNVYNDKLDDIGNKYNNTYHSTIKMKPADVKSNTYINSSKVIKDEDPKFKIGEFVRISKYKTFLQKPIFQIGLKKGLLLQKLKQKTNQKEYRVEKVIKRKSDELYVKWKGYDTSFNSWIDKKDII